jgi:hypothetical protein
VDVRAKQKVPEFMCHREPENIRETFSINLRVFPKWHLPTLGFALLK